MRALVTGATGFLGTHLTTALIAASVEVRALYRSESALAALRGLPVDARRGDVTDRASLDAALAGGVDWVFHVAASTASWRPQFAEQQRINVAGTQHVLEAALTAGVRRFVHTSTVAVYGFTDQTISERSPLLGRDSWHSYARTKTAAEDLVRAAIARGLDAVILNPTHILGPGDRHNWSRLLMLVDQQKLPGVPPGRGAFVDVRAAAAAHVRAAEVGATGENYLLGGEETSFLDLVQRAGRLLGRPTPKRALPAVVLKLAAQLQDGWSRISRREPDVTPESVAFACQQMRCDIRKAQQALGLQVTPLDTLLADTIAWLRAEGLVGRA